MNKESCLLFFKRGPSENCKKYSPPRTGFFCIIFFILLRMLLISSLAGIFGCSEITTFNGENFQINKSGYYKLFEINTNK